MSADWRQLRRGLVGFAVLCLCVLTPALRAVAQTGAAIGGAVTDAQGGALPGVSLTLRNDDTGVTRTTTSDGAGAYRFAALPPGRYDLTAELDGFGASELKDQTLTVGLDVKHDIVMKIQSLQESVTVTAAVPVIETNRSDVSNVVNERQIDTVPVPTRQTLDLALLVPGTNTDNSVPRRVSVQVGAAGAIARNLFLVDGVTNQQIDERRLPAGFSARRHPGVPRQRRPGDRGVRRHHRRRGEHCHQGRDESVPRRGVRVLPQQGPQCDERVRTAGV